MSRKTLINIRVSEREREALHEAARRRGVTLSELVRRLAVDNEKGENHEQVDK